MRYLLDTSIVIELLRQRNRAAVLSRIERCVPGEVVTSAIVAHELAYGAAHSSRPEQSRRSLALLLDDLQPLSFTREDAAEAGAIRAALRSRGSLIGPYDMLIAGQAKARGLALVTNNEREFARVHGLVVENWLTP